MDLSLSWGLALDAYQFNYIASCHHLVLVGLIRRILEYLEPYPTISWLKYIYTCIFTRFIHSIVTCVFISCLWLSLYYISRVRVSGYNNSVSPYVINAFDRVVGIISLKMILICITYSCLCLIPGTWSYWCSTMPSSASCFNYFVTTIATLCWLSSMRM